MQWPLPMGEHITVAHLWLLAGWRHVSESAYNELVLCET